MAGCWNGDGVKLTLILFCFEHQVTTKTRYIYCRLAFNLYFIR